MASQTKMIFITSDEDLVHKISLNKSTNTRIIDLDDHEQMSLTINDNNIIDLAFAELSQLNSTSDQIYRQMLDSTDHNQSKQTKVSKKSVDLICKICGDHAIGFNYDVLSCASCKAFFRRNAYQQLDELKCITGKGECLIAHGINRKCHRCRLDRCFAMGMRKDFIVKKEEKQKRKKHRDQNENIPSNSNSLPQIFDEIDNLLLDLDNHNNNNIELDENTELNEMEEILFGSLSIEDSIIIQNIQSLFVSNMQDDNAHKFCIETSNRDDAVKAWLQSGDQTALRFINFFRQIEEFEGLNADDRFILMKYNLLPVFPIYKCFNYKPELHYLSYEDNEDAIRFREFCRLFDDKYDIRDTLIKLITSIVQLTKQDPTILSFVLIIIVFSSGLSMNEEEPVLKDSLAINRVQSHYIKIFWNYLITQLGEQQACKYFIQLLPMIFQLQSTSKILRDFILVHHITRDSVDQITPLMQSVLNIS